MPIRRSSSVLILTLLLLGAATFFLRRARLQEPSSQPLKEAARLAAQVAQIEQAEQEVAATVWTMELLAQKHGRVFEQLWDSLNAATGKLEVAAAFPVGEIVGPAMSPPTALPHSIFLSSQQGEASAWTPPDWKRFILGCAQSGWQLDQVEFRHLQFERSNPGRPGRSKLYCSAHLTNPRLQERAVLDGDLLVTWDPDSDPEAAPAIRRLQTERLSLRTRKGRPAFEQVLLQEIVPPPGSYFIDPLVVRDLDDNGFPEIILLARNLVFRRQADGEYQSEPLCRFPPGLIFTGILGDFDSDRATDFLCAAFEGLLLFRGSPAGSFDEPGRLVWSASPRLKYGQALTCGDIDGDGDLDVWLGQYKVPYDRGQMPTPVYDANDGFPSYLLLNDSHGSFSDATLAAGLGAKRWRRVYSASLVDINGDGPLDLVVASDFAGLDVYTNDGRGQFKDITSEAVPERHAFGMSQVTADFNADGLLDLLMMGMNVPVADRLQHFQRARPGFADYLAMTSRLACGNRLFLGGPHGRFKQSPLNASIARTGWSWAGAILDFDNDFYPDVYIPNGHETKQSVRDYETEFWLHDIYVGNSKDNLPAFAYFRIKEARTRGQGMSYGGYEKNRLLWNQAGTSFLEIGHLFGVALEQDSRNALSEDLNNDGRRDLLVTTFEAWPKVQQTLRIYTNALTETGNWIGFRLGTGKNGASPVGAQVTIRTGGRASVQALVAGDSYRSQSSDRLHFGVGPAREAEEVEIRWPDGRHLLLTNAPANQYHPVRAPLPDR